MKRTTYLLFLLLFLALITTAWGCEKNETAATTSSAQNIHKDDHTINTPGEFVNSYRGWANRLDSLAERTQQAYIPWSKGEVPVEKYLEQTQKLYEEMKALSSETDLKTEVDLKAADEKAVKADAVMKAYLKASKDLNDFLVVSNTRPDDEIRAKYQELMVNKYPRDMNELKKLLAN